LKREILITAHSQRETRVAILEDDRLVELLVDRPEIDRTVGNIYLGKVEAVLPGMQAGFVDIGTEKSAFLHASDLVEPKIQDKLKKGENILVQVTKEPIGTKGPRVTAQVSLAGRFLVYMPMASKVGVSRKIAARDERFRLRRMVRKILPQNKGGVIIRTVAEDLTEDYIKKELKNLLGQWKKIRRKAHFVRLKAPVLVHREASLTGGLIRDLFSDKVDRLLVDSKPIHKEINNYLAQIHPELRKNSANG
jgi:ribonuclease G